MNILVIVSRDSEHPQAAGGDHHMTQLAQGLARLGNRVSLLSATDPSLPREATLGNLTITRIAPPRTLVFAVWARILTDLHGKFDVIIEEAIGGERAPFLSRVFSGGPVCQFWYQDNRPLFAAAYGKLSAVIAGRLQGVLLRMNRSGFALANSRETQAWLVTQGFSAARTAVFYPKFDFPTELVSDWTFEGREDRIVVIGNFRPTKRFEEAIQIFARLKPNFPLSELVLIGREDDELYLNKLRALVTQLGLEHRVRFLLGISEFEKFRELSRAKVLTIHSPIEGFALTIPEAGFCGVPVVGNRGVPRETLRAGVNGESVAFGDLEGYCVAVRRLLTDRDLWEERSRGARKVAEEFVSQSVETSVTELIHRCASTRRALH